MKAFRILIFSLLISSIAQAQPFDNSVVKTKPYRTAIEWNPNLMFEKQIGESQYSWNIDANYFLFYFPLFEPFPSTYRYQSSGTEIQIGFRRYLIQKKSFPAGPYIKTDIGFRYQLIKDKTQNQNNLYYYTFDLEEYYPFIDFGLGYQFKVSNRISLNFNGGIDLINKRYRRDIITHCYDQSMEGAQEQVILSLGQSMFYFTFDIGIILGKIDSH